MKYYLLKEIIQYLSSNAHNIKLAKRIDNNTIIIEFNNSNQIYFDMSKGNSLVYKRKEYVQSTRDFNAPFDVVLQKGFIIQK